MSSKALSDAEVHELIMARQASRTREEWQELFDRAAERFGRDETTVSTSTRNGSHPKSAKKSKKSSAKAPAEVIAG
jgi:hypothetical protein